MTRRLLDRFITGLTRLILRVFFRRVEVRGLENIPSNKPLIVTANHGNSLIDPILLTATLPVPIRFLAKSTLWEHPFIKYAVRFAGSIPIYRRKDEGVDTTQNARTFEKCWELLAQGGAIALFPEGVSHVEPYLMPMKTGAARIALEAQSNYGPMDVRIVPVGLSFDARGMFRSRALVLVGEAIDPSAEHQRHSDEERPAVRALTQRIDDALRSVTLNYDSWSDAGLIERAAALFLQPELAVPTRGRLTTHFDTRQAFIDGYKRLQETYPEEVAPVAKELARYDRLLAYLGLTDAQVASHYPLKKIFGFVARTFATLALWVPLALVGFVFNWLSYKIPGWLTALLKAPADQASTYKVFLSLVLFPLTWGTEAVLVGWKLGWSAGLFVVVLAPLSGYAALRFGEIFLRFFDETRAYLLLGIRGDVAVELKSRRQKIYTKICDLVELHGAQPSASETVSLSSVAQPSGIS